MSATIKYSPILHALSHSLYSFHVAAPEYTYRLRKPGQPHFAKAGNLNHALFHATPATSGQYILVLDCDMVPKPDIVQALLPHCLDAQKAWDPSVAFVQSPQAFYNLAPGDPFNNASPVCGIRGVSKMWQMFLRLKRGHPY
jgi:cellulose synthase/poly-beta-1,6-N-acetylglucosamine synthase-like glycosyltransferase